MFLRKIIPQDKVFFKLFRELAGSVREAGEVLTRCAETDSLIAGIADELKRIEHHADDVTHALLARMESTFVTPFDREDIHRLADRLDEVIDMTEEAVRLAVLYGIERLSKPTAEMARVLGRACAQVADAVAALPATAPVLEATKVIRTTETEGDALYCLALGELFENATDALEVIKWKDIITQLENAIDATEDVAGTLEGIALKHG